MYTLKYLNNMLAYHGWYTTVEFRSGRHCYTVRKFEGCDLIYIADDIDDLARFTNRTCQ